MALRAPASAPQRASCPPHSGPKRRAHSRLGIQTASLRPRVAFRVTAGLGIAPQVVQAYNGCARSHPAGYTATRHRTPWRRRAREMAFCGDPFIPTCL